MSATLSMVSIGDEGVLNWEASPKLRDVWIDRDLGWLDRAKEAKEKLWEILDVCLKDRRQAWMLQEDGKYARLEPGDSSEGPAAVGTHAALMDLARRKSE